MTTHASGNTKPSACSKKRDWFITMNASTLEHYNDIRSYFESLKSCTYALCVEHIGQENKHYHLFAQFKTPVKLSLKKLYGAHVEYIHSTPQDTVRYMKCEDDKHKSLGVTYQLIDEWGELRSYGGSIKIKDIKNMNMNEIDELPAMYHNIASKIKLEQANELDVDDLHKDVKIYYIYGPSGVGKTQRAKEIIRENIDKYGRKLNMIKYENGFYNGTSRGCPIAIYDDFRDSHMKPSEFINLIDYNVHPMNIKGGSMMNEYKLIIITSVQDPHNIYHNVDDEPRRQWLRRMEIIEMNENAIDIDSL